MRIARIEKGEMPGQQSVVFSSRVYAVYLDSELLKLWQDLIGNPKIREVEASLFADDQPN